MPTDPLAEFVDDRLSRIGKQFNFGAMAVWSVFLASLAADVKGGRVEAFSQELPNEFAGLALWCVAMLCTNAYSYHFSRLKRRLSEALSEYEQRQRSGQEARDPYVLLTESDAWILNPFAHSSGLFAELVHTLSHAFVVVSWWMGVHLSLSLMLLTPSKMWVVTALLLSTILVSCGNIAIAHVAAIYPRVPHARTVRDLRLVWGAASYFVGGILLMIVYWLPGSLFDEARESIFSLHLCIVLFQGAFGIPFALWILPKAYEDL